MNVETALSRDVTDGYEANWKINKMTVGIWRKIRLGGEPILEPSEVKLNATRRECHTKSKSNYSFEFLILIQRRFSGSFESSPATDLRYEFVPANDSRIRTVPKLVAKARRLNQSE